MINHAVRERPILFGGEMVCAILDGRKTQTRRVITKVEGFEEWVTPKRTIIDTQEMLSQRADDAFVFSRFCPYGASGDRLWVREAWRVASLPYDECPAIQYTADKEIEWCDPFDVNFSEWEVKYESWYERMNDQLVEDCKRAGLEPDLLAETPYEWDWDSIPTRWRPSIHMPRWASRIMLEITGVRVERVQGISVEDAEAEGIIIDLPSASIAAYYGHRVAKFRASWDSLNAKRGYGWDANPWVWVLEFKEVF